MKNTTMKANIAIVEKCVMSAAGLRYLLNDPKLNHYAFHFFEDFSAFRQALKQMPFFSVMHCLSGQRTARMECLIALHRISLSHPGIQRIVLAGDEREARLVGHLSPARFHGILSKSSPIKLLLEEMITLFGETRRINENMINHWYVSQYRVLSPTEREILSFMTQGFSMAEIASQLDRNVKTIRAHKFNAMTKLGVRSDLGLLDAADILTWNPPGNEPCIL